MTNVPKQAGTKIERRAGFSSRRKRSSVSYLLLGCALFLQQAALAQDQSQPPQAAPPAQTPQDEQMPPGYPSLNDPWTKPKPPKNTKPEAPPPTPQETAPPKVETPPPTTEPSAAKPEVEMAAAENERVRKHEVSVSGDYLLGQGNVTMPFGFSLAEGFGGSSVNITKSVAKPDRTSDYFGGTISYSYRQTWSLDLTYANGTSSGDAQVLLGTPPTLNSAFTIKDQRYQAYIRYKIRALQGSHWSAYLRAGFSYDKAELTDETTIPVLGLYHQTDNTDDLLGNFGFGVYYKLISKRHVQMGFQVEGEGFYGRRTQKSTESLANALFTFPTATIDNDLYGGIGRGTVRFEYFFGREDQYDVFADAGVQANFTMINYSEGLGSFDELLWGPYVKVGFRFKF